MAEDDPTEPPEARSHAAPASVRSDGSDGPIVVGIGASADGLEALEAFFDALPDEPGLTFMVAQHLAPDQASHLSSLLQATSSMEVREARQGETLRLDHVYVLPPGNMIAIDEGEIRLSGLPRMESGRNTIDFLFRSIAEQCGDRSVGVLLSGADSDGTTGLRLIKEHGGITLAQSPIEAGFDTMPRSAINADVVDFVLGAADLADRVGQLPKQRRTLGPLTGPEQLGRQKSELLDHIMGRLRRETGTDLSEYKRPTVLRRIGRRMQVRNIETLDDYADLVDSEPDELHELFDELLIGVTNLFRNPDVWDALREHVVPGLFSDKKAGDEIRVWVPGCATGEEAYTVALLLSEYAEDRRDVPDIKIFATDIDREAIDTARKATYPPAIAADIPRDLASRFFRVQDGHYHLIKTVRRHVMFATQNVLTDPPFSHLDLVTCRNLMIYLESDAQKRLLEILHYALRPEGWLVLGESETPTQRPELFGELDDEHHIYRASLEGDGETVRPRPEFGFDLSHVPSEERTTTETETPDVADLHRKSLVARFSPPSIVVDSEYDLLHVVGDVEPYLSVRPGRAPGNVLEMLSEDLRSHVRTMLFEAFRAEGGPTRRELAVDEDHVAVTATRLDSDLVELTFEPPSPESSTAPADPSAEERRAVEQLERELQGTRDRLQSTIFEYESTNEKLRASNEELMSMNEELQSTTEELQTSKEELQSMNEELTTVNDELSDKIQKLDAANSDLRNLMRATDIGTLFLDRDLTIKRFTEPATEYVNLIASDEGRPFEHVTHNLDTDALPEDARAALEEPTTIEREVSTEEGQHLLVRSMPYLNVEDRIDGVVLTFIDITDRKRYQETLVDKRQVEKLAELRSMFLSTLSHDVRTPVSAIVTMTEILRRELDETDADMLDRIERSTEQLRKILDSILRMARLDTQEAIAEPEQLELVSQVEEIADLHGPIAEREGLDFTLEAPDPPVDIRLDPRFLAQILNNLVDNAVKYTDEGEITVRVETDPDHVRIHVDDTGPGIHDDEREQIFERARTGSRESDSGHREGLGLAIANQLTKAMGGTLSLESTVGEGSTFTVEFSRGAK